MLTSTPFQTTYTQTLAPGYPGMLANEINFSADTRNVETAGGIGFGLAVSQGADDMGCIIGGSAFVGITRADITVARSENLTVDKYPQYDNAAIILTGDVWVRVGSAVTKGNSVSYNTSTGVLGSSGTAIDSSRWMTSAASGGLAVARLGNIAGKA